jgi:hypothetical protein
MSLDDDVAPAAGSAQELLQGLASTLIAIFRGSEQASV